MSQLELEQGSWHYPSSNEGHWTELKNNGFVELARRREDSVDLRVMWRQAGNLVLLSALTNTGERASTLIDPEETIQSLAHPSQYFSQEASGRLFDRAA